MLDTEPALALLCQRVLAIPVKKAPRPVLGYLSDTELTHVLAQIDRSTQVGERDYLLVALLYDTGARIQELLDLAPCDVRFAPPPFVRLFGKGRRERLTPLLPQTARMVRRFLATAGRREEDTAPLIQNRNGQRLTRHGARYLLDKYVQRAQASLPSLARTRVSPHTFRHTKAMHLLLGRPQFSWTRIKGESDVAGGRGHGWIETGEGSWVGADGGSPEGDRSRRRRGGGGVGGLGAGATVEREPETGRGVAAAARRAARRGLA